MKKSLPSRERGLKLDEFQSETGDYCVAPLAGAWIEIPEIKHHRNVIVSLPSRERGLKCHDQSVQQFAAVSLPSRERGLKYAQSHNPRHRQAVAPLAGAWIEIIWQEKTGMRK